MIKIIYSEAESVDIDSEIQVLTIVGQSFGHLFRCAFFMYGRLDNGHFCEVELNDKRFDLQIESRGIRYALDEGWEWAEKIILKKTSPDGLDFSSPV